MTTEASPPVIEVYNSVDGAAFFQRLLAEWRAGGAEVTSIHAIAESAYRMRRGALGKIALRARMYVGYGWSCWRSARAGRTRDPIRVVTTNPFFAPALIARAAGGRGATINLLYDLFPEALVQAGTLKADAWATRRCAAITRYALRECAATVFLGERLRAYAEATYGPARRAVVIPVGADGTPFRDAPPMRTSSGTRPRILYSGQMGRMHDTATLAAVLADPAPTGVAWTFHAGGAGYAALRRRIGARPEVRWGEALGDDAWQRAMRAAEVALVTIAPGAERVVMPSKTYSALVAGQAVLAVCPRESDLADLIGRHDCGWVVVPGDVVGLRRALADIAGNAEGLWAKRLRAYEAGHALYDMGPVAARWRGLFAELAAKKDFS